MIDRQEIMDFAREFGLAPNVIEKDYVLGWILAGIFNASDLGESWLFKGGTCLKKCYFETYRFSEDLDFTLTKSEHLSQEFLADAFKKISNWVYDASGIELPQETIRFDFYKNSRGNLAVRGRIGYRGPMQARGEPPKVRLDLTHDEIIVLDPAISQVHHPYSDQSEGGIKIHSYCFEEVFAEKLRALGDRLRPRDLYDVIHLYRHDDLRVDSSRILETLEKKCTFKGLPTPTFDLLKSKPEYAELESEWGNMLRHQLPILPAFEQFWDELPTVFEWLYGTSTKTTKQPMPTDRHHEVDATWQPSSMVQAWHTKTPLEIIRFAGANHLCIDLDYVDLNGNRGRRLIEPYSLYRTKDGNIILRAIKHETNEARSYRIERIEGAEVTQTSFAPQFLVNLTPVNQVSSSSALPKTFGSPQYSHNVKAPKRKGGGSISGYGLHYIFKCSLCGKKFTRGAFNAMLNAHKNRQGYPCPGRVGIYETSR